MKITSTQSTNGNGVDIHIELDDSSTSSLISTACGCYHGIPTRYGMDNPIVREVVSILTIRFLPWAMVTLTLLLLILSTVWAM